MELMVVVVLIAAVLLWLFRPPRTPTREPWEREARGEGVDQAELEAAEREVQGLDLTRGEEESPDDDWGPGAGRRE